MFFAGEKEVIDSVEWVGELKESEGEENGGGEVERKVEGGSWSVE